MTMETLKPKYKYYICEFVDCTNDDGSCDMDILPAAWFRYNNDAKLLEVPYPDPPYTKRVCLDLQESVRHSKKPAQNWKMWAVQLKGGADTYEQAESRLQHLKKDNYAFSTDQDDPKSKAEDEMRAFCNENLNDILADNSSSSLNRSSSDEEELTDSSTSNEGVVRKRNVSKVKRGQQKKIQKVFASKKNNPLRQSKSKQPIKSGKKLNKPHLSSKDRLTTSKSQFSNYSVASPQNRALASSSYAEFESQQQSQNFVSVPSKEPENVLSQQKACRPALASANTNTFDLDSMDDEALLQYADETLKEIHEVPSSAARKFQRKPFDAPAYESATVSPGINAILKAVVGLKMMMLKLQGDVTELKNKILGSDLKRLNELLSEKGITMPMSTSDEWVQFCGVMDDGSLEDYMSLFMKQQLDKVGNNPTKSCTNILRRLFSKDLALKFTAFKKVNDREFVFRQSTCFKLFKMVILSNHRDNQGEYITESTFNTSLSAAFNNAKDWGGRMKKQIQEETFDE